VTDRHCGAWAGVWLVVALYSACAAAGALVARHLFDRLERRS
jgi:UPF0716 family protein affecting phage T7 exclusion